MTQGRYSRIKSRFWTDGKSGRWGNDVRLLALYLLTCPHGNMLGCFVLPKPYACADLRWDANTLETHFDTLRREDFIRYDEGVSLILVTKYLKHNPIENPNQATAALKVVHELPRSHLLADLGQAVKEQGKVFLEPLVEEIGKQLGEPLGEPLPERYGQPVSVSGSVTVTDPEKEGSSSSKMSACTRALPPSVQHPQKPDEERDAEQQSRGKVMPGQNQGDVEAAPRCPASTSASSSASTSTSGEIPSRNIDSFLKQASPTPSAKIANTAKGEDIPQPENAAGNEVLKRRPSDDADRERLAALQTFLEKKHQFDESCTQSLKQVPKVGAALPTEGGGGL